MDDTFSAISEQTVKRYSDRYRKFGYDTRTLGWGSKEQQEYRFAQTVATNIEFGGKVVLDIGCGFGDYFGYLRQAGIPISGYVGWDINPDLINEARARHQADSRASFEVRNVLDLSEQVNPVADVGISLGVLNFNLKHACDNYDYSYRFIAASLALVRCTLIVDFLSVAREKSYPQEDFVFYHDPSVMLNYALTHSSDVLVKHDYSPIPQKEFMLVISKDEPNAGL